MFDISDKPLPIARRAHFLHPAIPNQAQVAPKSSSTPHCGICLSARPDPQDEAMCRPDSRQLRRLSHRAVGHGASGRHGATPSQAGLVVDPYRSNGYALRRSMARIASTAADARGDHRRTPGAVVWVLGVTDTHQLADDIDTSSEKGGHRSRVARRPSSATPTHRDCGTGPCRSSAGAGRSSRYGPGSTTASSAVAGVRVDGRWPVEIAELLPDHVSVISGNLLVPQHRKTKPVEEAPRPSREIGSARPLPEGAGRRSSPIPGAH